MTKESCACGFTPDQTLELADHFLEMFAPDDDIGADGQLHVELTDRLTCSCGFTAIITGELDEHFRSAFPPLVNRIGRDGRRHQTRRP